MIEIEFLRESSIYKKNEQKRIKKGWNVKIN